jgi:hypothetical protein
VIESLLGGLFTGIRPYPPYTAASTIVFCAVAARTTLGRDVT